MEMISDEAMKDARAIGEMLRDQYNMQPSKDDNGFILPPPSIHNFDALKLLNKQTMIN